PIVAVLGFLFGMVLYWISVNRVVGRPVLMRLLATFAMTMVLIGLGTALWSTSPYNVPVSLPGITWQGYTFTGTHIMAAALAGVIAGLLCLFLYRRRSGMAIRAFAYDRAAPGL